MKDNQKSIIPHLSGIRGCAILLILLFHIGITGYSSSLSLPGGYLGVEIFLVMSGFLLALGLTRKVEGIHEFARKKLLRIMYPVSVTLVFTMLVCLFCMDYADLLITAKNALWSSFAVNNIQLAESGAEYFSDDSTWNPLLHTWYIAITVQIYILFYLGYRLQMRWNKWLRYGILFAVAIFSFFYAQCHEWRLELVKLLGLPVWLGNPDSMYYSTLGRLWEPLAGAAVLLLPACSKKWLNAIISALSVVSIGLCVWLAPTQSMLLVVLSTMLLLRYGGGNVVAYLYNNKLMRGIGTISFSLYLVHMPIIVCHKAFTFTPLGLTGAIAIIIMCFVVGIAFFFLVEKRTVSLTTLHNAWGVGIIIGIILISTTGLKNMWNAESNNLTIKKYPQLKEETLPSVYSGFDKELIWHYPGWIYETGISAAKGKRVRYMNHIGKENAAPTFVLMGDSHARHYVAGLDILCKKHGMAGVNLTTIVIPFWNRSQLETTKDYFYNKQKHNAIMNWLKAHPELTHIIIGQ